MQKIDVNERRWLNGIMTINGVEYCRESDAFRKAPRVKKNARTQHLIRGLRNLQGRLRRRKHRVSVSYYVLDDRTVAFRAKDKSGLWINFEVASYDRDLGFHDFYYLFTRCPNSSRYGLLDTGANAREVLFQAVLATLDEVSVVQRHEQKLKQRSINPKQERM